MTGNCMTLRLFGLFVGLLFIFSNTVFAANPIELANADWKFLVNPNNLEISAVNKHDNSTITLSDPIKIFSPVTQLQMDSQQAKWYYQRLDMQVTIVTDNEGLIVSFTTNKEQSIEWPVAGISSQSQALIIPAGEGMYVPNKDRFWIKEFKKYPEVMLSLPFLGVQYNKQYVSYLTPENERMVYKIKKHQDQLYIASAHTFLDRDHFQTYKVYIHLVGNSPIDPALDYRQWLIEHHKFVSLSEKISKNDEASKLLGAFHVWAWGDGKMLPMLQLFQDMNIQHLWIGYDPTPKEQFNITKNYINLAKKIGYLVAPYDSFDNAQDPKLADQINSIWENDLWQKGCIRNPDGSILVGFANRGCYLSSEAFRIREPNEKNISNRITTLTSLGDNSYFLDCDATNPLYDDYSNDHPMTQIQDKNNRLERMQYISDVRKLVLGSESALSWANPVISYNNGSFSTFNEAFWPIHADTKNFGGWFPIDAPQIFFKPYDAPQEFITAAYDPRYRLPLYEAALHDSVISTDRWELNELKIPAIMQTKALLESLYNVPAIWVLNIDTLKNNANRFKTYYQFFSPLHQVAALQPLTLFKWLSSDRLVQQTQFGNVLTITANFSNNIYMDIGSLCVKAVWIDSGKSSVYCPEK